MCRRNRQQRSLIAGALLVGFQEYQSRKSRGLPPSTMDTGTTTTTTTRSFQEPMTQGITYMAPQYVEPIDPNPPAYEDVTMDTRSIPAIVDQKRLLYRLSTEEQVPPHVNPDYNPNTGLDTSIPRNMPAPPLITLSPATTSTLTPTTSSTIHRSTSLSHLLEAISLYFDTQIKLHADSPATVRKLEYKKAKKLLKAEKKFNEHMAKGKDSKHGLKMEKRAEKMEKWTEWVLQKSVEHHEKHVKRHGRCCGPAVHTPMQEYRATVV
ncbi:hypothetical protein TWF281_000072 [Arthrobotrys megalospora]